MDSSSSGIAWPPALRRRLGIPAPSPSSAAGTATTTSTAPAAAADSNSDDSDSDSDLEFHHYLSAARSMATAVSTAPSASRSISAHQLRKYIRSSYAALTSAQRQLHRGEESYFEETYAHGSLLRGWDNIWIDHPSNSGGSNKGASSSGGGGGGGGDMDGSSSGSGGDNTGNAGGSSGGKQPKSMPIKRMPNDHRWFSSSCGSILPTGDGKIGVLENRASLLDRPPTPEVVVVVVVKEQSPEKEVAVAASSNGNAESEADLSKEKYPKTDAKEASIAKKPDDEPNKSDASLSPRPDSKVADDLPQIGQQKDQCNEQPLPKSAMPSNTPHPAVSETMLQDQTTNQSAPAAVKKETTPSPPSAVLESKDDVDMDKKMDEQIKPDEAPVNDDQSGKQNANNTLTSAILSDTANSIAVSDAAVKEDASETAGVAVEDKGGAMKESLTTPITTQSSSMKANNNDKGIAAEQHQQTSFQANEQPPPPPYSSLPSTKRQRVELHRDEGVIDGSKGDGNEEEATAEVIAVAGVGADKPSTPIDDDGGSRRASPRRKRKAPS